MLRAVRPAGCVVVLGCLLASIAGCSDRESLAYRVQNYDGSETPQTPRAADAGQQDPVPEEVRPQVAPPGSGPVQLSRPESAETVARPHAGDPENRFAFIDWFGNSANPAKVKDPVKELRKARKITAAMAEQPESRQTPKAQQPFTVSENSRLVPTYTDGLPDPGGTLPVPDGEVPQLRGADITGSVTPPEKPASRTTPASTDDPVKAQLLKVDERLRQTGTRLRSENERHASADPEAVTSINPQHLPDQGNPVRLHVALNGGRFDEDDLAVLKNLAAIHRKTGRKIHIHGVSRGPAGDSETSIKRVRRLHGHIKRAIVALRRMGVKQNAISTSTAEQRMTGMYFGSERPGDRDRLELSFQ